jgi:transposase
VVVEATSAYEWFIQLVEPLAQRVVLAHPKKLRIIAESTRKSDKLDAKVLAEELAKDCIPEAWRPSPRVRAYRILVRQRCFIQRRITGVKNKLRHVVASYNRDVDSFTESGRKACLEALPSPWERKVFEQLWDELLNHQKRLGEADQNLKEFAQSAPLAEREARALLATVPGVGPVTVDVVLSELGDWRRFRSMSKVTSYAGLVPGFRESNGKEKQLGLTKEGSRWLRWAMVELAWRLVNKTRRWAQVYESIAKRSGAKKAIVAVARRILGVLYSILRTGKPYSLVLGDARQQTGRRTPRKKEKTCT